MYSLEPANWVAKSLLMLILKIMYGYHHVRLLLCKPQQYNYTVKKVCAITARNGGVEIGIYNNSILWQTKILHSTKDGWEKSEYRYLTYLQI